MSEPQLRHGECLLSKTSGPCAVCKKRIEDGPAVQLSKYSSRIRHVGCMPKSDSRGTGILSKGVSQKTLPE